MSNFLEIVTVVIELLLLSYYFKGLQYVAKVKEWCVVSCFLIFGIAFSLISIQPINPIIRILTCLCATVIIERLVYGIKFLSSLYAALIFYIIAILGDILCSGILDLMGMPVPNQSLVFADRTIYIATAKLVHLIGIHIVILVKRRNDDGDSPIRVIPLILGQIISIFICHQLFLGIYTGVSSVFTIFSLIGVIYINIVICYYIESLKTLYKHKQEKELAEQQLITQQTYYEQVQKNQEETRALWHDIKKYLSAIELVANENCASNVLSCMKQTQESLNKVHKVVDVGNPIVNGVLEYGLNKSEQAGIEFVLDVWVSSDLNVSPIDLYIIIGNTVDNAIEECSRSMDSKKRTISITIKQSNHLLYYEIKNNMVEGSKKLKGSIHGYGLKNVQKCIEKYNGTFLTEVRDGVFIASAQLNI